MSAYSLGHLFGTIGTGCIYGLLPLFAAVRSRKTKLGVILLIACGLSALIHPVASVVLSCVSAIVLCIIHKKKK